MMKKTARIALLAIIILCVICLLGIFVGAAVLDRYSSAVVPDGLIDGSCISEPTSFYCSTGTKNKTFEKMNNTEFDGGVKYVYVSYSELPQDLIDAIVSIEDKRFYSHHGIDYKRSVGAVINYVFKGRKSYGGSTITQQLVKNITGDDEPSIKRKLTEAFCAMELEGRLDKSEILEKYLNVINLAHGCYGVGAAARLYFSKSVCELTLCECASIAAITNNPSRYSPINHPDEHLKRRNTVLYCMYDQGYISETEYQKARVASIGLNVMQTQSAKVNSWYIDMVVDDVARDLAQKYGVSRALASQLLYRGGYRIYTAMDPDIQSVIEEYYANECNFPISETGEMPQSSMIVMDQHTGDILGVGGAVGIKKANRLQNYATDSKRPVGSVIKPLSVYAPAIDSGLIRWSTLLSDTPIKQADGDSPAWPSNASGKYEGDVTVSYAIEQSLNTVAVKLLGQLGNGKVLSLLRDRLGLYNLDEQNDAGEAALALGQISRGVTLREIVGAYTVFDGGVVVSPRSYYKVTDKDGVVILDNSTEAEQVFDEESAAIMTKLMQGVVQNGTAKGRISLAERCEVAGKSGTTQNSCDRYFIGYTPTLLAGVWFGYDYPKPLNEFGGNFSVTVWDEVMSLIYGKCARYTNKANFDVPDAVQPLSYDKATGSTDPAQIDPENMDIGWFRIAE